ncbi:transferase family protein [Martensiomyces pterosporus]|nr:transferase family protein [Martensiomyces pterosporus]
MPSDKLQDAFYKALEEFPVLAGIIHTSKDGQPAVIVDKDNLNMPEYKESSSDVHFNDIREAGFDWSQWPEGVCTTGSIAMPGDDGKIKLANVHIVRLKENSGVIVFLNIPHYVVDGVGYFAFVNRWAQLCKQGSSRAEEAAGFVVDRSLIVSSLPAQRKPLDDVILSIYGTPSLFAAWLAWLSPNMRGRVLNKASTMVDSQTRLFHISSGMLDQMRSSVRPFVPEEIRVSDNDLVVALVARTIAQAQNANALANSTKGWRSCATAAQTVSLVVDIRHRLGISNANYTGNALMSQAFNTPLDHMEAPTNPENLAEMVAKVRRTVDNIDAPLIHEFIDMINSQPSCFTRPMTFAATHPASLLFSNQTRFRMYEADFGDGKPAWVSLPPKFGVNIVALMPCRDKDGVNIYMTTTTPDMEHILLDTYWCHVAIGLLPRPTD